MQYRADIDGLRAVAVVSVVVFHAIPELPWGGFTGVDIFFVISGYLISRLILDELRDADRFSVLDFYDRRIRRIFPALVVVMAATLAAGWFVLYSQEYALLGRQVFAGGAFVSNFLFWRQSGYFDGASETKPMLHLWSLAVEEQFYLVWPVVLGLAWRRRWPLLPVIAVLLLVSFACNLVLMRVDPAAGFYLPISRFWELLLGAALAFVVTSRPAWLVPHANVRAVAGLLLLLAGWIFIGRTNAFPGWWALLPVLGACLLISAGPGALPNRLLLSSRIMVAIGLISYPLYLWHWPLLALAQVLENGRPTLVVRSAAVVLAVLLAVGTARWIEAPLRRHPSRRTSLMLMLAMAVVTASGYAVFREGGIPARSIERYNEARDGQTVPNLDAAEQPCGFQPEPELRLYTCKRYVAEGARGSIVVWGDSSAGAWAPVFREIGRDLRLDVILVSHPSCPPLLNARKTSFSHPGSRRYCKDGRFQGRILESIRELKPELIFLIGAFSGYRTDVDEPTEAITNLPGTPADPHTSRVTLAAELPTTIQALHAIAPVVVFRSWPILPKVLESTQSFGQKLRRQPGPQYYDRMYFDSQRAFVDQILDGVTLPQLRYFDASSKVCAARCSTYVGDTPMYLDNYHITARGTLLFKKELAALMPRRLPGE